MPWFRPRFFSELTTYKSLPAAFVFPVSAKQFSRLMLIEDPLLFPSMLKFSSLCHAKKIISMLVQKCSQKSLPPLHSSKPLSTHQIERQYTLSLSY